MIIFCIDVYIVISVKDYNIEWLAFSYSFGISIEIL